jgi:Zn-dependent M28 family amino/carboxypeptidase
MSGDGNPGIPVAILSWSAGRSLVSELAALKQRIDATLKPQTLRVDSPVTLSVDVDRRPFATQNVLGVVEGSDSQVRSEAIVIGAHYDHDGEADGQIWYGADDNASGTAALIELAEAFAGLSRAPRRSIILAAFAGEEKGQVGSHHYVANPLVPVHQTAAMFQLDMIGRNEEHPANPALGLDRETSAGNANNVNVIGSTFSPDLARQVREANGPIGLILEFRYDQTREILLRRSDQWPFLQKRIPALFIHTGEHPDYHQPTDTADKINYPKLEKIVRLIYLAAERTANAPGKPQFSEP